MRLLSRPHVLAIIRNPTYAAALWFLVQVARLFLRSSQIPQKQMHGCQRSKNVGYTKGAVFRYKPNDMWLSQNGTINLAATSAEVRSSSALIRCYSLVSHATAAHREGIKVLSHLAGFRVNPGEAAANCRTYQFIVYEQCCLYVHVYVYA